MITKMKKLTFLVYAKEYEDFLNRLRNLGVVHVVEHQRGEPDEALARLQQKLNTYEQALAKMTKLASADSANDSPATVTFANLDAAVDMLTDTEQRIANLQQELATIDKDKDALQVWGDFSWHQIDALRQAGWDMKFYCCAEKDYDDSWDASFDIIPIARQSGKLHFVCVANSNDNLLPLEPLNLPGDSMAELHARRSKLAAELVECTCQLKALCQQSLSPISDGISKLRSEVDLMRVRLSGDAMAENTVVLLE